MQSGQCRFLISSRFFRVNINLRVELFSMPTITVSFKWTTTNRLLIFSLSCQISDVQYSCVLLNAQLALLQPLRLFASLQWILNLNTSLLFYEYLQLEIGTVLSMFNLYRKKAFLFYCKAIFRSCVLHFIARFSSRIDDICLFSLPHPHVISPFVVLPRQSTR